MRKEKYNRGHSIEGVWTIFDAERIRGKGCFIKKWNTIVKKH